MRPLRPESIWPLAGRLFLWLVPCYVVWHFGSEAIAWAQGGISRVAIGTWFPGLLAGWEVQGSVVEFATHIAVVRGGQVGQLTVPVDGRLYSYGWPLFGALTLAVDPRRWRALLIGLAILLPFAAWGVTFDLLKYVFLSIGGISARDAVASELERNLIALGYQVGTLILPAAAPVVAWGATHRQFLADWITLRPAASP
jgi:hypothetical protein